jgi:ADP-ribosyl-[dinitrogen reductase] hydrolase
MDATMRERARGCAVGAAVGDALGCHLSLALADRGSDDREMPGSSPAGTFTDDTEMALALAESLLAHSFRPCRLADRLVAWYEAGPEDIGYQTRLVLHEISRGAEWEQASKLIHRAYPDSAGNGSAMRCWPVALAHWGDMPGLLADSRLQSQVTHRHAECVAACAFVNMVIYELLRGTTPAAAVDSALESLELPELLQAAVRAAPFKRREELLNSGWVRHTAESAVWGLLTTGSFGEAIVQVATRRRRRFGSSSDGALAGATIA